MTTATIPHRVSHELEDATPLLGDRPALDAFWNDNGYLFFRGVFDRDVMAGFRAEMLQVLAGHGYVEPGSDEPVWTGKEFTDFGIRPRPIYQLQLAERFFARSEVREFLARVIDDEPVYLPMTVYRFTPPVTAAGIEHYLTPPHQDAFFNPGYDFRILWVPLMDIGEDVGGLALAPGAYKRGLLHDAGSPPNFPIPSGVLDDDIWARADYRAGDLLMMNPSTPHGGLPNTSRDLRLTMDLRIAPATGRCPVFGEVVSVDADTIVVRAAGGGADRAYALDDDTFILPKPRTAIGRADIAGHWNAGEQVMIAAAGDDPGRATLVRRPAAEQNA